MARLFSRMLDVRGCVDPVLWVVCSCRQVDDVTGWNVRWRAGLTFGGGVSSRWGGRIRPREVTGTMGSGSGAGPGGPGAGLDAVMGERRQHLGHTQPRQAPALDNRLTPRQHAQERR